MNRKYKWCHSIFNQIRYSHSNIQRHTNERSIDNRYGKNWSQRAKINRELYLYWANRTIASKIRLLNRRRFDMRHFDTRHSERLNQTSADSMIHSKAERTGLVECWKSMLGLIPKIWISNILHVIRWASYRKLIAFSMGSRHLTKHVTIGIPKLKLKRVLFFAS